MRAILLALAMLSAASPTWAHAFLERTSPAVGSEVPEPPRQVVLTFSESVEPLFSTIELHDAHGATIPIGKPQASSGGNRQLVATLPPLSPGTYTVAWHATSVDTHKTEGSFRFTVK